MVFEKVLLQPNIISQQIVSRLEEFGDLSLGRAGATVFNHRIRTGWLKPPISVIKINCDAGFDKDNLRGVGGIVARNSQGQILVAGSFDLGSCGDATHAEAKAIQKAMDVTLMMGFNSVIFEGDCKVVIDEINRRRQGDPAQDFSEVEDIISSFLLGSSALTAWSFIFSKRETNSLAHYLASRRKSLDSDSLIFPPIPGWLETLASCDVMVPEAPP